MFCSICISGNLPKQALGPLLNASRGNDVWSNLPVPSSHLSGWETLHPGTMPDGVNGVFGVLRRLAAYCFWDLKRLLGDIGIAHYMRSFGDRAA